MAHGNCYEGWINGVIYHGAVPASMFRSAIMGYGDLALWMALSINVAKVNILKPSTYELCSIEGKLDSYFFGLSCKLSYLVFYLI